MGVVAARFHVQVAFCAGADGLEEMRKHFRRDAADLFAVDTRGLELAGALHDPRNLLARTGVTGCVNMTMINGRVVYADGELKGVDEQKLAREGEEVCSRVLRDRCDAFRNLV